MYPNETNSGFYRGLYGWLSSVTFFGIKLNVDCLQHLGFYRTDILCDLSVKGLLKNSWKQKSDQMLF